MAASPSIDYAWRKLRDTEARVAEHLVGLISEHYGEKFVEAAWRDFTFGKSVPQTEKLLEFETIFLPWLLFNWIPRREKSRTGKSDFPDRPIALKLLKQDPSRFNVLETRFIEAASASPYSFFAVNETVPGESVTLRDVFLNEVVIVKEREASRRVQKGDVLFTRILSLDGTSIMLGCAPLLIPPRSIFRLFDTRDSIVKEIGPLSREKLHAVDPTLRRLYRFFLEEKINPSIPRLTNTDGDPFLSIKLHYELKCDPEAAVEKLRSLALFEHGVDRNGNEISIDWHGKGNKMHKGWDNTLLGTLRMRGRRLTVEVNSEKRSKKIQAEIAKRLGDLAVLKGSSLKSPEKMLREGMAGARKKESIPERSPDLNDLPEVQAKLKEMAQEHWRRWPDEKIPILGNQTPRQAAKTVQGRERLEALLTEFEWHSTDARNGKNSCAAPDIAALRKDLGL
ncbi:MAG: hypothetical protein V1798_12310 [Pseudomonadota bacterium]